MNADDPVGFVRCRSGDFSRKMTRCKLDTVMLSFDGVKFTGKVEYEQPCVVGKESNSCTSADLRVCDSALTWRVGKTGSPGVRCCTSHARHIENLTWKRRRCDAVNNAVVLNAKAMLAQQLVDAKWAEKGSGEWTSDEVMDA
eukprot:scaffold10426_cov96-Skeletonema_dohrnii-CCMP3373.AAC.3